MKKLNLGKELSKNAQKKVVGGATIVCVGKYFPHYEMTFSSSMLNCGMATAYCCGQQGYLVSCTN